LFAVTDKVSTVQSPTSSTTEPPAGKPGLFARASVRRAILAVWLVATIAGLGVAVRGFRIDNSVGVWFAAADPALADYRQFLSDFGGREWILVALRQRGEGSEAAADRQQFAARLERIDHVHRVLSSSLFPPGSAFVRKFLKPNPASPYEALLVQVTNDIDRQDGYREALVGEIRAVARAFPTIETVRIAGTAVINGELNRSARRDMFLFFPLVALFVALLGALVFRNVRDTAVLLSVALGTVVVTEGLLLAAGYPLNMVTIMLPTVLIALSVADAVHLIQVFHAFRADGSDGPVAAARAVKSIAWPCAGTSLTTIAGFLAFAGSSVLPVFQLAVFGAGGIALAWVLTMTGAPALLVVVWRNAQRSELPAARWGERLLGRWWAFADGHPRWIVAAFLAGGVSLVGLLSLKADTDYVKFFRSHTRVPQDYRVLQHEGFPQNPLNLVLRLPDGAMFLAPQYWIPLQTFARELESLPGVHSVLSPFAMADAPSAMGDQVQTLGGMLSRQGNQLQLIVMMDHPSSQRLFALLPSIRALADTVLPSGVRLTPTGTALLWANMDDGVIRTQRQSLAIVCVVCFVILAMLFRSPWLAALGMAVSFYPVAMVLGLMGLWHIPVNLATVLIAGIAVGLAVDDTIHYVHAYQERRRRGMERAPACEDALSEVGLRMVMTSLILVGGFAIMGLSDFMPTSEFGLLSSLTILLALAADVALLPVVLAWRRRAPVREREDATDVEPARAAWGRVT
jgi:predicted RND superfamily exporter protein